MKIRENKAWIFTQGESTFPLVLLKILDFWGLLFLLFVEVLLSLIPLSPLTSWRDWSSSFTYRSSSESSHSSSTSGNGSYAFSCAYNGSLWSLKFVRHTNILANVSMESLSPLYGWRIIRQYFFSRPKNCSTTTLS